MHPPSADWIVMRFGARRAARSAVLWGAVFVAMVFWSVVGFTSAYPTRADQKRLANTLGSNRGLAAIFGPARHVDTVAGWTAWRTIGILTLAGAVWGLFLATRLLRGEEDAGVWDLAVAGPTTRRRATVAALGGLGIGLVVLWTVVAAGTVAVGRLHDARFPVGACLFFALVLTLPVALFVAVGALVSQLAGTRRRAGALGGVVLGVAFLLRVVANSGDSLRFLEWITPLGWIQQLRPLTGSHLVPLVPVVGFVVVLLTVTVLLAGARDVGAGLLPARDSARSRTRLLGGVFGLAARLDLGLIAGWLAAVVVMSFVFGVVSPGIAASNSAQIDKSFTRLGIHGIGTDTYLAVLFLMIGSVMTFAAAAHVAATREQEADGHLDHVLTQPVSRTRWLVSRCAIAVGALLATGLVAGIGGWLGVTTQGGGTTLPKLLAAGLNLVAPALLVLGVGTLAHGLVPRYAAGVAYGLCAWSILVVLAGALGSTTAWLLDLSVLHHIAPVPATGIRWAAVVLLVGIGLAASTAGTFAFARRDLEGR
jgi:ABC-2 type transport system permease protein